MRNVDENATGGNFLVLFSTKTGVKKFSGVRSHPEGLC